MILFMNIMEESNLSYREIARCLQLYGFKMFHEVLSNDPLITFQLFLESYQTPIKQSFGFIKNCQKRKQNYSMRNSKVTLLTT